ncbi:MAG: DUF2130 domain-containing protein [Cryobacterium sp.]|nr:DUF2130 domain-containing protein [Cryobacterium sp.]
MHEIKCPHCGKTFTIDEAGYADIAKQVRDNEFDKQLHERLELADADKQKAIELAETKAASELQKAAAAKDAEIQDLKAKLDGGEVARKLAVTEALGALEKERDTLANELKQAKQDKQAAVELAQAKLANELQTAATTKDAEIQQLKAKLDFIEVKQKLEVVEALGTVEKERDALKGDLERTQYEKKLAESSLKEKYETQIKDRDDTIERLKDLKARLSTKMVGESLEQHCEFEFERLRSTAFQSATFGKDNDASSGSKGDYIFRDNDPNGVEYISIMFEMKNESDATKTKQRNEDFLKELDKDRTEKHCDYAVLVSMLEPESDLYNAGIVDVAHIYPKMYVVRPQFFIPIITLLRNAAQSTIQVRSELARVQEQNVDITNFEESLQKFKKEFSSSYGHASTQFDESIHRIDEAIKDLEKTKEALRKSLGHLSAASNKADNVTIRALTRGNPTMEVKFAELEQVEDK